jgi:hypothetical protein
MNYSPYDIQEGNNDEYLEEKVIKKPLSTAEIIEIHPLAFNQAKKNTICFFRLDPLKTSYRMRILVFVVPQYTRIPIMLDMSVLFHSIHTINESLWILECIQSDNHESPIA